MNPSALFLLHSMIIKEKFQTLKTRKRAMKKHCGLEDLSPLPENLSLLRLGMKAAWSEAEAESPLPEPDTMGFSPCVVHYCS
jgi:hypothetical protein